MSAGIRVEQDGHVVRITIDRPEVLNALDEAANRELERIWGEIEEDRDVWCVILTGAGERAFCVGADMSADASRQTGIDYWHDGRPNGFGGIGLRVTLDVPVIARVNGFALGGGMEMLLGTDIVVAAEHAELGLPEPRVGRMPLDGGAVRLARQLPYHLAAELLFTGRRISAHNAFRMGLVNEVVPMEQLDDAVDRWVADVLACAPLSIRAIKHTLQRTAHLSAREAQALRTPALVAALRSADGVEGLRAFQEKRPAVWRGE